MEEERQQHALGLADIEPALDGALGRIRVAERLARDRFEQTHLRHPDTRVRDWNGAVKHGRERGRRRLWVVLGEPQGAMTARITAVSRSCSPISARTSSTRSLSPMRTSACSAWARMCSASVCRVTSRSANSSAARKAASASSSQLRALSRSPRVPWKTIPAAGSTPARSVRPARSSHGSASCSRPRQTLAASTA